MKRKISSFIFALILITSLTTIVLYAGEPSAWASDSVNRAIEEGLVPESLRSDYTNPITRSEFAALTVTLFESRHGEIVLRLPFASTLDANMRKAASIGVITNAANNMMSLPSDYLQREEAALMLSHLAYALGYPLLSVHPVFADNNDISPWAFDAVGQMLNSRIMGGVGYNIFAPSDILTREQSIVTIMRLLDSIDQAEAPDTSASASISLAAFEREIFELTNRVRADYGLGPFIWDYTLASAARSHSRDLATNNLISHTGSDGSDTGERIAGAGLTGTGWGENINGGINNAYVAVSAWLDSPGNRVNILSPHMTHLGVGFYYLPSSQFVFYTTQKFVRDLSAN